MLPDRDALLWGGLAAVAALTAAVVATTQQSVVFGAGALLVGLSLPPTLLLVAAIGFGGSAVATTVAGPLTISDVLLILFVARSFVGPGGARGLRLGLTERWLVGFLAWGLFATWITGESVSPLLRIVLYAAVALRVRDTRIDVRFLFVGVLAMALWNQVTGVAEGQARLIGTLIGDPAQTGGVLLAALLPVVLGGGPRYPLPLRGVLALVLLLGVWQTQTRGIWFALLLTAGVAVVVRRGGGRARVLLVGAVITAAGFLTVDALTSRLGLNAESGDFRIENITNGIRSGLARPVFGSGWANAIVVDPLGNVRPNATAVVPYNLFINVFAGLGIIGLVLLLGFVWTLLGRVLDRRDAPAYFVVAFLALSLTEMTLYAGSLLTLIFFVYLGLVLRSPDGEACARDRTNGDPVVVGADSDSEFRRAAARWLSR